MLDVENSKYDYKFTLEDPKGLLLFDCVYDKKEIDFGGWDNPENNLSLSIFFTRWKEENMF